MIGWVGPVFWPFAYSDFVDYIYYPYAYDTFWPYAYDDVYEGIFGPYAYGAESLTGTEQSRTRRSAPARTPIRGEAIVCSAQVAELSDWPIEQIAAVVDPNEPPMPGHVSTRQVLKLAESLAR